MDVTAFIQETISKGDAMVDGWHAGLIVAELQSSGWEFINWPSECTAAVYERHLKKGSQVIEVLQVNFMGKFTSSTLYSVNGNDLTKGPVTN